MTATTGGIHGEQKQVRPGSRILVVDDEKFVRDVFRRLISSGLPDCKVDVAVNGAEAVCAFRRIRHSVLVMDLKMPIMDGATAFKEIRKMCEDEGWEMPSVIFCTGHDPSDLARDIVGNDPTHCLLIKPVRHWQLVEAIQARLPSP